MQDLYPSRLEDENIINRVDPVVYSKKMITEHSLNKEQLDSYEKNGFIVFPKLFSKDEIKAFKEELKSLESNIELRKKDVIGTSKEVFAKDGQWLNARCAVYAVST